MPLYVHWTSSTQGQCPDQARHRSRYHKFTLQLTHWQTQPFHTSIWHKRVCRFKIIQHTTFHSSKN